MDVGAAQPMPGKVLAALIFSLLLLGTLSSVVTGALGGATFAWRAVMEEGKVAEQRAA